MYWQTFSVVPRQSIGPPSVTMFEAGTRMTSPNQTRGNRGRVTSPSAASAKAMPQSHSRGLLDTSVVIGFDFLDLSVLPEEAAVSAITIAELSSGPSAATTQAEQSARQDRLQRVEAGFDALPFDSRAARAFGRIAPVLRAAGRKPRGANLADYLIAATALAHDLPLYTLDHDDIAPLTELIEIVAV